VLAEETADVAEASQGGGLAGAVSGGLGDLSCGLVQGECLVQVPVHAQEVAELGGQPHRVNRQPVGCGVVRAGLQTRPLGLQPGECLFLAGQLRRSCWRAGHRGDGGGRTLGGEPVGGCGEQVVIQQPPRRGA
jgi:hypothetical protein